MYRLRLQQTNRFTSRMNSPPSARILAIMEARTVTGPAKNLIGFGSWLGTAGGAQAGFRMTIATYDRGAKGRGSDEFVGAARAAGIETHVIRERRRFDLGVMSQLREIVAALRPDILQTHNSKSHLLVKSLAELRAGRLWFAFQHGYAYPDFKQRLYNQVDRLTFRSADRVVSVCRAFAPKLVAFGVKPERIRVLHNAAVAFPPVPDLERMQLRDQLGIRDGECVLLTVGRLSREKGHADLIRALERLCAMPQAWKLVLVGSGPEEQALGRLARALDVRERVVFAGSHPNVAPFYAIADLFVLPSHTEGSSNVLLEAMTAGIPIVATRAGGNPEIVLHEQTGLLVPVGDAEGLASAIARLNRDPELAKRLAGAALVRAAREFSVEHYQEQLLQLYTEALGNARRRTM